MKHVACRLQLINMQLVLVVLMYFSLISFEKHDAETSTKAKHPNTGLLGCEWSGF